MPIARMVSGVIYWYHDIEEYVRGAINIKALYRFLSVSYCI